MEPRSFQRKWNRNTTTSDIKRHGWVTWRNTITRVDNTLGGRSNDCGISHFRKLQEWEKTMEHRENLEHDCMESATISCLHLFKYFLNIIIFAPKKHGTSRESRKC
ncbi:hypothetical protein TB2_023287 [Malus domestica]